MTAPDPIFFPIPYIRHIVGEAFRIEPGLLVGGNREADVMAARHMAIMIALLSTNLSVQKIGKSFYIDNTSVKYAAIMTIERVDSDPELMKRLLRLRHKALAALPSRWRRMRVTGTGRPMTLEQIADQWCGGIALRRERAQKKRDARTDEALTSQP